jgi:hypothetical protein
MKLEEIFDKLDAGKQLAREGDESGTHIMLVAPENLPQELVKILPRWADGRCIVQWNPPGAWSQPFPHLLRPDDLVEWVPPELREARELEAVVEAKPAVASSVTRTSLTLAAILAAIVAVASAVLPSTPAVGIDGGPDLDAGASQ